MSETNEEIAVEHPVTTLNKEIPLSAFIDGNLQVETIIKKSDIMLGGPEIGRRITQIHLKTKLKDLHTGTIYVAQNKVPGLISISQFAEVLKEQVETVLLCGYGLFQSAEEEFQQKEKNKNEEPEDYDHPFG